MLARENSVVFLAAWIDACALWRLYMPHLNMPGTSFYAFRARPDFNVISGCDIVVVQRCCTPPQFEFLRTIRQLGMQVVYDLDDDVWDLPEYNPAHEILTRYKDGFNYCIQMVDAVTVSTKTLAKVVKKNVKTVNMATQKEIPVFVCENRIDTRMFVEPVRREEFIVGWAGSSSHVGDLVLVEDAIIANAAEFPHVAFEFRGCEPPPTSRLPQLPNFRQKLWSPVAEFGARMPLWGWSIALAPVTTHDFNNSKSAIKMVEAAYCGIPCLASWVRPYDEFCSHDPELKWLLCPGVSAWKTKMRDLINDPARRHDLAMRMQQVMRTYYSLDRPHEGWSQVIEFLGGRVRWAN